MAHLGPHLYTEDSNDIVEPATDVFEIDDFTSPSDWEKVVMSSNLQQTEQKIIAEQEVFKSSIILIDYTFCSL